MYVIGTNYWRLDSLPQAESALQSSLRLAQESNQKNKIAAAYNQLAEVYARMKQFERAYNYNAAYARLRDSLRGKENAVNIAKSTTKYQVAEKNKELAQKKLQIAQQEKKQYLWTGLGALLILSLLVLLWRKQHKASIEKLKAALAGEEKERERMARELHDGIVSRLSVVKTSFSILPQYLGDNSKALQMKEALQQLDQSIVELRTTSHNLLPQILQRAGLAASVRIYCEKISQTGVLDIAFQMVGSLPRLNDEFQLNIYRIIQELVQNIIKHAEATKALVQFTARGDTLDISVDNNGRQKPREERRLPERGIGLYNLQSRIKMLNGSLEMEQDSGNSVYMVFNLRKFRAAS